VFVGISGADWRKHLALMKRVVEILHAAGVKVCGPSWYTGDYSEEAWLGWRAEDWAGVDLIAVQAYWADRGFTPWNAMRPFVMWSEADGRALVIVECFRDQTRDGEHGTMRPHDGPGDYGWQAQGLSEKQALGELSAYEAAVGATGVPCVGLLPFVCGPTDDWRSKGYSLDPIVPALAATSAPRTEPYARVVARPEPEQNGGDVTDARKLMLGAMWRQGSDLLAKDQTAEGLLADLKAGGFVLAISDVAQGTTIQGTFSKTGVDFPTVDAVVEFAKRLHAGGVRFWPMFNVLGADPEAEANLHAQVVNLIALAVGEQVPAVCDFERYPGFFDPSRPEVNGSAYFARMKALLNAGNELWACIDPREPGRDYAASVLSACDRLLLQTYDKDFQQSIDAVYAKFLDPDLWGGKPYYPMVQGDDATLTIRHGLELVAGNFPLMVVWGFGSLVGTPDPNDVDDLSTFSARSAPYDALWAEGPAPAPAPTPMPFDRGQRWEVIAGLAREFRERGGTHADLITANGLDNAYQASKVMAGADPAA
jgi:hypothetical protein